MPSEKKFSCVLCADIHIHPHRICSNDGGKDRLKDGLVALAFVSNFAISKSCPLIIAGDLKQREGVWPQDALAGVLEILREVSKAVPIVILSGNGGHDGTSVHSDGRTGIIPFQDLAELYWRPGFCSKFSVPLAIWPWQPTTDALPGFLNHAKAKRARVLVGHGFFEGVSVGSHDYTPRNAPLTMELFGLSKSEQRKRVFDVALFGDIHKRQTLGDPTLSKKGVVVYPGSLYAQRWDELETDKGALYVEMVFFNDYVVDLHIEPVVTPHPRFRVIDLTNSKVEDHAWESFSGDFVRVVCPPLFSSDILKSLRERSKCRVFEALPSQGQTPKSERRASITPDMSERDLVKNYILSNPPPDYLPVRDVAKFGLEAWTASRRLK
jgi:DNA repair exonuclease SbcCD nuclease subunit